MTIKQKIKYNTSRFLKEIYKKQKPLDFKDWEYKLESNYFDLKKASAEVSGVKE
jgi:hypothetical protein